MATSARTTTNRKPRGAVKPKAAPRLKMDVAEVLPALNAEETAEIPAPPEEPECPWPFEIKKGRCPVAVFNAPGDVCSMNEKLSFGFKAQTASLRFERGVMPVFEEENAERVRSANPGGRVYVEGDEKFGAEPLMCSTCAPKTRWYSVAAYERHVKKCAQR